MTYEEMLKKKLVPDNSQQAFQEDVNQGNIDPNNLDAQAIEDEIGTFSEAPVVSEQAPLTDQEKYKALIDKYEAIQNAPKQETDWRSGLPDMLAGAHNILNYGQGSPQANMKLGAMDATKSAAAAKKKAELEGIQQLQDMYQKYMASQKEDARYNASLGEKESARAEKLSEAQKERDLKRELAGELARTKASSKVAPKSKLQETREAIIAKRYGTLEENIPSMKADIKKAKYLANALEKGEFGTGPLSEAAGKVGSIVSLKSSSLKEELDSLAESAARAQLKASGEIRPTDADVEGMKRAMFNLGNTEETNIKKLNEFIKQQEAGLDEYGQMKKVLNSGKGLEDFLLKDTYKNEPVTALEKQRSDAEKWALANPEDPRAVEILKRLGK